MPSAPRRTAARATHSFVGPKLEPRLADRVVSTFDGLDVDEDDACGDEPADVSVF
jgi:hypothetical protein